MKTSKSSGAFSPFEKLKDLLEKKPLPSGTFSAAESAEIDSNTRVKQHKVSKSNCEIDHRPDHENDMNLFLEAMDGVKPMRQGNRVAQHIVSTAKINADDDSESEALRQLNILVKTGEGFVVKDTPEYIEGTGHNVHPKISTRLHRGDFSIQAHVDLHGFGVEDARNAFENFIKDSIATGKRAVLIVHGRGLSSPDRPVLKTKVVEWLTRGPFRKWVIAFSSARSFDGGAGATYVLLRQRPLTRRYRKKVKHRYNSKK
ncbi:MAG: Smr/MutS family protein [Deltaproteobacteria bacterium]|jgi:DNA-nicking Smr family endonuclease|nr:Smr/MutS family protein [Deltaproteobacteria bacterium]